MLKGESCISDEGKWKEVEDQYTFTTVDRKIDTLFLSCSGKMPSPKNDVLAARTKRRTSIGKVKVDSMVIEMKRNHSQTIITPIQHPPTAIIVIRFQRDIRRRMISLHPSIIIIPILDLR
jgi:hypothetical protein